MALKSIGFTGTRQGMTHEQKNRVFKLVKLFKEEGFGIARHGVCVGADADFHTLVTPLGYYVVGYPGVNKDGKCFTRAQIVCDELKKEKFFIHRDYDIVEYSDVMIATPKGFDKEIRSGTWTTISYAIKKKKPLYVVYPDGRVVEVNVGCQDLL